MGGGGEEVFGVVGWVDAVGEGKLIASLFLSADELAMSDPNEGMKPEEGAYDGGEKASAGIVVTKVGRFVEEGGIGPSCGPIDAVLWEQNLWANNAKAKGSRR